MSAAQRYLVPESILNRANAAFGTPVVLASDYDRDVQALREERDTLAAENKRLRDLIEETFSEGYAAGCESVEQRYGTNKGIQQSWLDSQAHSALASTSKEVQP
jgi:hypothetical protein